MDLIFTNALKEELGVLFDYEFDLAFGKDENNFECTIQLKSHCMEEGSFLYIEGTEYGGIVDKITVDTEQETVMYSGRTWHGILAGTVLEPDDGYDYLTVSGEANSVLYTLIDRVGLSNIFGVNSEDSGIDVAMYKFKRYVDAYNGICDMLAEFNGKLKMEYQNGVVVLSAVYLTDFSQDEEWDSSQVTFTISKNHKPVNHLICLGSGNLRNRHVIHLFTDEFGGVQQYKTVEHPDEDADYILDTSKKVLTGIDEVADVFDYANAQTAENFITLEEQPSDWAFNYAKYYKRNELDEYIPVEHTLADVYTVLAECPADWETAFANYFVKSGNAYKSAESVATETYRLQNKKPSDWEDKYESYFTYYSDGVSDEYPKARGVQKTKYNVQTKRPTDWSTNYGSYYKRSGNGFTKVTKITWTETISKDIFDETITVKRTHEAVPDWKPNKYYTSENYEVAPEWKKGTYYTKEKGVVPPTWAADTYYSYESVIVKPPFSSGVFFRKAYDNFSDLVSYGLQRLKESLNCNSVSIDFDLQGNYDIGDIVGANENTTGISVWQPITKKIVTIKDGQIIISYKVGD